MPQKGDVQEFTRRIGTSFHMPRECYCATDRRNDYMAPPTSHCVGCNNYLPLPDTRFSTQDFWPKQPKRTLAYTKALQHWAEVAKLLQLDESHQLAECVKELRRCMRPFTMLWRSKFSRKTLHHLGS